MTRPKLHRCADLPGHELRAAVAQLFRFRALAGGDAQDLDIVLVNPLAGRDRFRGEADHLAELENWLAWSNGCRRHFVPAQDALTHAGKQARPSMENRNRVEDGEGEGWPSGLRHRS